MIWIFLTILVAVPLMSYGLVPIIDRLKGKSVPPEKVFGGVILVIACIYMTSIFAENAIHPHRVSVQEIEK